ncbi:MAG: methionine adenosyltransferase [Candidatus Altiarchaeota archaeon]|nr:methionine adenosyltransferase [Candidatus Altiarchaeota archaeon]
MRNIVIEFPKNKCLEKQAVELVERKGLGHPDSICDGIAESVSRALSKEYVKRYGRILHHNTDQVELVGGQAEPVFGGGEVTRPIYFLLSGRATTWVDKETIPVGDIATNAARDYLKESIRNLDVDSHVEIEQRLGQGSADLRGVFAREGIPRANDTSFGAGFAPLSTTERLVFETERFLINSGIKEVGEDVKIMGLRLKDEITLTIACAMVSRYLDDLDHYQSSIEELHSKLENFVPKITDKDVNLHINTADDYDKGIVYLTVTGTSAEQGDDGSVGRGNRANGLITPYRPMSLEATSGKNPVNHVGKIYNLLAKKIAEDIAEAGAEQAHVKLLSQIGKPIDQPLIASVHIIGDQKLEKEVRRITNYWLENVTKITEMCLKGEVTTF